MTPTPPVTRLVERSEFLVENARFVTLATEGADGPWASTVNYVPLRDPLRLLWYSLRQARHSRNIEARAAVSGSLFLTGLDSPLTLDGAQFTATAQAVGPGELEELSRWYYERNFPDEAVRARWRLPLEEFRGDGPRRFYLLTVREWWLLDTDGWLRDMNDRRIGVPLPALAHRPAARSGPEGRPA
ncbi:pyridoxamine 5'-phosphate oxidase family protein [Streptomyces sp. NPDC097619]|uniref:pyridoxamine 5'-phosphate oxidase family protein n=1 Tax=Streptomyces sp. NPDC097619 TaxID=3157228 RepID=UPI00331F77C5